MSMVENEILKIPYLIAKNEVMNRIDPNGIPDFSAKTIQNKIKNYKNRLINLSLHKT